MNKRILIVDDEPEILELLALYLRNEGFSCFLFPNGKDALDSLQENTYDLAILDLMLPDMDGFTICSKIREHYKFPIIMLTARNEDMDKITGLTLGADDYVTKPFNPLEIVARVKAQMRRLTQYHETTVLKNEEVIDIAGLSINYQTHQCFLNNQPISLTPTEFSILWYLCQNRGCVVSSEQLFQAVWKDKYFKNENNTVMVHIRRLREKLHEPPGKPNLIKTGWGVGYKIEG